MRIAIIGSKGMPARSGGVERHVEELAPRLAKLGFRVTVYTRPWYTGSRKTSYRGVRLVPLASVKTKHLDAITHTFLATLHALKEHADVFHYHGVGPALLAWLPRLFRPSAKVVVTFHSLDRRVPKWGALARLVLKLGEWAATHFAHETIVISKTLAHYVREVYDCQATYIPNGVHAEKPLAKDAAILAKLRLEKGRYVVMVSRLIRSKKADALIEAWKLLKASATNLRVLGMKLVIVGDGDTHDPYVWEVRAKAVGAKDIVLAGARFDGELRALLANAAFAVHPSATEGLPMSVLEKMGYGKAVLTSNIPEHLELIEGRGFTFRLGDAHDLMLQLYWIMTHPRACAEMGQEAKKHVLAYYNWGTIAKETALVYAAPVPATARKASHQGKSRLAPSYQGARRASAA